MKKTPLIAAFLTVTEKSAVTAPQTAHVKNAKDAGVNVAQLEEMLSCGMLEGIQNTAQAVCTARVVLVLQILIIGAIVAENISVTNAL